MAIPEQFQEVGATVAILPYSINREDVQFATIAKVTATQVTVEFTSARTAEKVTKRFYQSNYRANFGTWEFPALDEYGTNYRSTKLVLKDDPEVARYIATRAEHLRDVNLRELVEGFASRPTIEGAKSLIHMLDVFITTEEAKLKVDEQATDL